MKNKKWILVIIGGLILLNVGFFAYKTFIEKNNTKAVETKTLETISGYDYKLEDRDTTLYKEEFNTLKTNLTSDNIDYTEYAKSIAKLYIIDLYTLNNKLNKYDIGSKEFIYQDALDNYILKAGDTLYKYVEDNTYNQRKQELPIVKSINVTNVLEGTYNIKDQVFSSYEVTLTWEYTKDNDYDKSAKVIIIRNETKLSVVEENRIS